MRMIPHLLLFALACGDADKSDTGSPSDSDSPSDTDPGGDTDSPADTDPGGDTDVDPGTDPEAYWPADVDHRVCADGTADFTDIQPAVAQAAVGDVIGVCPGVYGPVTVSQGQDLRIYAIEGRDLTTIAGGSGTAVHVNEATLDLSGFHLTGTSVVHPYDPDEGAALSVHEGVVTLSASRVDGASGPFAIFFDEDVLVMEDVVFEDNVNDVLWYFYQGDLADVRNATVLGGIHQNILLTERLADLEIHNSVFARVTIDTAFSAFLETDESAGGVIANNVFHDIDDLDPFGGRLLQIRSDFRNNIVLGCDMWNLVPFEGSYNLFWDNSVDYAPYVTGTGNLYADPELTDAMNGDYTLQPGSPAIDAGDPGAAWKDADGTRNDIGVHGGP